MTHSLRKPLVPGQATTGTRIATGQPQSRFQTSLFQCFERALAKHNPTLSDTTIFFHEELSPIHQKAFFKKAALPVTTHLLSIMICLEETFLAPYSILGQPHSNLVFDLLSEVAVDLDCFFIGSTDIKARLVFQPLKKTAAIIFVDKNNRHLHAMNGDTTLILKQLPNNLGYTPPGLLCPINIQKTSHVRLLSDAEVLKINTGISAANEEKSLIVKQKLTTSLPVNSTTQGVVNQVVKQKATEQNRTFDDGYVVTRHWR